MSVLTSPAALTEHDLPLILRLTRDAPVTEVRGMKPRTADELDRFLLAQRPALQEAAGLDSEHPSRVYIHFGGEVLNGTLRVHLQVKDQMPLVTLEHDPTLADCPEWTGQVGDHHRIRSPYSIFPTPDGLRSGFVYLDGKPVLQVELTGWFGDGIDMRFRRLAACPPCTMRIVPLQVGREFVVPPLPQTPHFLMATGDLPLYTPRRG